MSIFKLNIAKPCREEWQNMTPNELGRHCQNCQKTVVDFSSKTDVGGRKTLTNLRTFSNKSRFSLK